MKPKAKYDWTHKRWDWPIELIEAELHLKGLAGAAKTINEAINPKPVGEIVNPHVYAHVPQPQPNFIAMNQAIANTTGIYGAGFGQAATPWNQYNALAAQNAAQNSFSQCRVSQGAALGVGISALFGLGI